MYAYCLVYFFRDCKRIFLTLTPCYSCSQIRDFDATLRGRHPDKAERIIRMLERAYVFHVHAKTSFYPDAILATLLHLDYLRRADHPGWHAFQLDPNICSEEHGEITLSQLANAAVKSNHKREYKAMKREYIGVGASAHVNKESLFALGISSKNREHISSMREHDSTVHVLIPYLKSVAREYINHQRYYAFAEDDVGVTWDKIKGAAVTRHKRTWARFFPQNMNMKIEEHIQRLGRRYSDNTDHPEIAAHLHGIVGDNRYTHNPE